MTPPAHKHDYDSLQVPGFQWYQFDPSLSGTTAGSYLEAAVRNHPGTPERMTWKAHFRRAYAKLGAILCPKS